jgi:GcrA cell cycle regulator
MSEMARRFAVKTEWTDEHVDVLKSKLAEGRSFTEIANAIGSTKSAVSAKAFRLNLSPWTDEATAMLRELWADDNMSAANIANILSKQFGGTFGRNAVLGKVHRLGLPNRNKVVPAKPRRVPTLRRPPRASKRAVVASAPVPDILDAADIPFEQRRSLLELTSKTCKWPVGNPSMPGFFFCGAEPVEGKPYCACHAARAYQKPPARKNLRPFHDTKRRVA